MANPQKENGYIGISFDIWEALTRTRIPGQAMQVLMFILRKTYGWSKKEDQISLSQFQESTNLSKVAVCKAIKKLLDMNMVTKKGTASSLFTKSGSDYVVTYSFQKDYDKWIALPKKVTLPKKEIHVTQKGNPTLPKMDTTTFNSTVPSTTIVIAKLHPIQKKIDNEFPNIKKVKYQLTYQEADRLSKDYSKEDLLDYFCRMENYAKLSKNNNSVYLTFKCWHRKDHPISKKSISLHKCPSGHSTTYIKKDMGSFYLIGCRECPAQKKIKKDKK